MPPDESRGGATAPRPRYRRYRRPLPSTRAVTAKILALGLAAALGIGALISVEMAAGDDPTLGPKATATAKKSTATPSGSGSSLSSSAGSSSDPYSQAYGYPYSSGSGSSGYPSAPAPVTSGTS
jgi:hypothetical protein